MVGHISAQRILKSLFRSGCQPAEPGSSQKSFLNGKMDPQPQAEGIKELVEDWFGPSNGWQRQLATGRLSQVIEGIFVEIIGAMAYLEARIDFPDEGDTQSVGLKDVVAQGERLYQKP